jgi:hypothetical protein
MQHLQNLNLGIDASLWRGISNFNLIFPPVALPFESRRFTLELASRQALDRSTATRRPQLLEDQLQGQLDLTGTSGPD